MFFEGGKLQKLFAIPKFDGMIYYPNCKINLGLYIESKRDDGYHNISTLMYPIPIQDILELTKSKAEEKITLQFSGKSIPGKPSDNLCVKAYNLLNNDFSLLNVQMHLHKIIPMGGGLGGGSSNGAFMLKALNDLFDLNLSTNDLCNYATKLGSDCAFFIENKPQFAEGRGEVLTPSNLNLSGYYILLVNDGTHVSTIEAYQNCVPKEAPFNWKLIFDSAPETWRNNLKNDFEAGIFIKHRNLQRLKNELYELGAVYASMSGSGATMYGIFNNEPKIPERWKGYYVNCVQL